MTTNEAKKVVASVLALNTIDHVEAAHKHPALQENTIDAGNRNREAAEALDCLPQYWHSLALLYPDYLTKRERVKLVGGGR